MNTNLIGYKYERNSSNMGSHSHPNIYLIQKITTIVFSIDDFSITTSLRWQSMSIEQRYTKVADQE